MNDIDGAVRCGLARLADDLAPDAVTVRPEKVRERYRRRRHARAAVLAVTAAVVGIGLGVPAATGWLAAAPESGGGAVAGPGGVSTVSATPGTRPGVDASAASSASAAAEAERARALAALAAQHAGLAQERHLQQLYTDYMAVHECLTAHGYAPAAPVGREAFVAGAGANWKPYDGLSRSTVAAGTAACPLPADSSAEANAGVP